MTYREAVKAAREAKLGYTFTRLFVFTYLDTEEWHWGLRVPVWSGKVEEVPR